VRGRHRYPVTVPGRAGAALRPPGVIPAHPAPPPSGAVNPIVSLASASVSSQANPAAPGGGAAADIGPSARRTDSSVHMPSAEPCSAPTKPPPIAPRPLPPPPPPSAPPLRVAAARARHAPHGPPRRGPGRPAAAAGGGPIRSAVMAVRARGQMALAVTPYLAQLRAAVTVSAAIPALAAA